MFAIRIAAELDAFVRAVYAPERIRKRLATARAVKQVELSAGIIQGSRHGKVLRVEAQPHILQFNVSAHRHGLKEISIAEERFTRGTVRGRFGYYVSAYINPADPVA